MIFAHTLAQVLNGQKSQTRRLVKPDEVFNPTHQRVIHAAKRTVYQVGKTYAVQPNRGKKSVARILLTGLRQETPATISEADALAEGFPSRAAFLEAWRKIHGQHADLNQPVWILEFALYNA